MQSRIHAHMSPMLSQESKRQLTRAQHMPSGSQHPSPQLSKQSPTNEKSQLLQSQPQQSPRNEKSQLLQSQLLKSQQKTESGIPPKSPTILPSTSPIKAFPAVAATLPNPIAKPPTRAIPANLPTVNFGTFIFLPCSNAHT